MSMHRRAVVNAATNTIYDVMQGDIFMLLGPTRQAEVIAEALYDNGNLRRIE